MLAPGRAIPPESRPGGPLRGFTGPPTFAGLPPGFPRPSGGARHRRAGSSAPLVVPEVAQLRHPYTSITRGRTPPTRRSGIASQSPAQSPLAPSAPRASPACGSLACCASALPDPAPLGLRPSAPVPPAAPAPRGQGGAGRRRAGEGPVPGGAGGGLGRDQVPHVGVDVVDRLVVVVGVVRRHLLDTGGDAPHCLDFRLRGRPAPLPLSRALPYSARPSVPSCLPTGAHVTLSLLAPGLPPCPQHLVLARSLPSDLSPVSRVPTSVNRALTLSAGARVLPRLLPVSVAVPCVPPSAAHAVARPVRLSFPAAAGPGALPVPLPSLVAVCAVARPLGPSPGAASRACVLPVPLSLPFAVPCVPPSAARALAHPVWLSSPAAAGPGILPVPWPSLIAACALARPLLPPPGAPSVAFRPSLRAPVAGTPPRPITVSSLLDHVPGVSLQQQLRQRDARRRTLRRRGPDGPQPPLGEGGLGRVRLGGLVWVLLSLVCARYLAPSPPSAAAAAAPGKALRARVGTVPRASSVPGSGSRPAGSAAATPCASGCPPWGGAAGAAV